MKITGKLFHYTLLAVALLSNGFFVTARAGEAPWTLVKNKEDVQIFTRSVPGSEFLQVKAVAQMNASMETVINTLGNGETCSEWRKLCKSSKVLQLLTDKERYVYMVLNMPWPLADRDLVIHSTASIDSDNKTYTVDLSSAADRYPQQEYVRAQSSGSYQLSLIDQYRVQFTWIMHTDLGGKLSPNVINKRLVENTFDDVVRLVNLSAH